VIDDRWVSVGSANFDNRSFRLNDEANLNVMDKSFAEEQAQLFEKDKQACRQVTLEEWNNRPWSEKAIENLAGLLRSQV
jgi:cardiolipin synthase